MSGNHRCYESIERFLGCDTRQLLACEVMLPVSEKLTIPHVFWPVLDTYRVLLERVLLDSLRFIRQLLRRSTSSALFLYR